MNRGEAAASPVTPAPLKLPWFPWIGKKRPYYGWVIVFIAAVKEFSWGIINQSFGTYFVHLQQQFGWSRAIMAAPKSFQQAENAVVAPLEGFLMDKYGPRAIVAIGIILMGLGAVLYSQMQSLWMYFVATITMATGQALASAFVFSIAINHWFRRRRTMGNGIMGFGYAASGVVAVPIVIFLQTSMGWRFSAAATGVVVLAVALPLSLLIRRSPEPYGLLPDGDTPGDPAFVKARDSHRVAEYDFTLRGALRTRAFWLIMLGPALVQMGQQAIQLHLFLHLEQGVGLSRTAIAMVWSATNIISGLSRLVGAFFGDHFPKHIVIGVAMIMMGAGILVLGMARNLPMVLLFIALYGIGWGARPPLLNAMEGDYFGRKSQGIIRGWLRALHLPFAIAAPVVVGFIADIQGTYGPAFITLSFFVLAGAAMMFLATPPRPPVVKESDARHVV
ncbi:MAG: MFS transporter [Chloroflexi bacterium]|nr:MFS transporter [Chloroflexota bacterium]